MMNTALRTLLSGVMIAALGLLVTPSAEAASIKCYNGVSTIIVNDDPEALGTDPDGTLGPGVVSFAKFSFGDWSFVVTAGFTKPALGSAVSPIMQFTVAAQSSNPLSSTPSTLEVSFSEDSFGPSFGSAVAFAQGVAGGTTVTYETFQDGANSRFAGSLITSQIFPNGPYGPPFVTAAGVLPFGGGFPYALTQKVTFVHTAPFQSSTANVFLSVPDGGLALSLLGFALVGVEGLRRKFRKP